MQEKKLNFQAGFLQEEQQKKMPNDLIFPPAQYIIFASISTRNTVEEPAFFYISLERLYFIISKMTE